MVQDGGQYCFTFNGTKFLGLFHVMSGSNFNVEVLEETDNSIIEYMCPVLLELNHVILTGESIVIDTSSLNFHILNKVYIVHVKYFIDHIVQFRFGMLDIYCIDDLRFVAFDFTTPLAQNGAVVYANDEYNYLASRIAIVDVSEILIILSVCGNLMFFLSLLIYHDVGNFSFNQEIEKERQDGYCITASVSIQPFLSLKVI